MFGGRNNLQVVDMLWHNFVFHPCEKCVMWDQKSGKKFHVSDINMLYKKSCRVGWVFGCADQVEFNIIDVVWILFATKGYTPKIDQTGLDTYPPLKVGLYTAYMKLGVY